MFRRATCLALLAAVLGCQDSGGPATVRGRVLYRQSPISQGLIVFSPDSTRGSSGPLARADIQPDGSYDLRGTDGAAVPPGYYRVTVAAVDAAARSLLPDKYRDPALSGLACEVQAGRDNRIDFNLQ